MRLGETSLAELPGGGKGARLCNGGPFACKGRVSAGKLTKPFALRARPQLSLTHPALPSCDSPGRMAAGPRGPTPR